MKKYTWLMLASLLLLLAACPEPTPPDKVKPTLSVTAPIDGVKVDNANLTVTGTAKDDRGVTKLTIQVNDGAASDIMASLKDDNFSTQVTLKKGANKIIVTAADAAGNSVSVERNVTFFVDETKPTLSITSPTEGATVTAPTPTFTIAGNAADDVAVSKLTIKVNDGTEGDITGSLKEGAFATQVALKEGANKVVVTASDAAGNSASVTRNFTLEIKAAISGHIWFDANGNGTQDNGEPNLAGRTVFLDTNNNGVLDTDEVSVKTDADGKYVFNNLTPGTYNVNQVLAFGESFATAASSSNIPNVHDMTLEQDKGTSRIVGGVDTNISEFPFMLALGRIDNQNRFRQFCGATLISRHYAVTAAHCVQRNIPTLSVLVGTDTLGNNSGTIIRAKPISHPKYEETNKGYDIAVLELATPVDLSKHYTVEMIDASTVQFTKTGTIATTTGWGALASGSRGSARLQVVHTKIFDAAACAKAYAEAQLANFDTQLCAGVPEGGVDACQGDSGGPLFVRGELNGQKRWFHAGATSWGYGCAWAGFPGIWARTSVLQPWIISQAIEKSTSQQVVLSDTNISDINFANKSTVRPFINEIKPRWQTTNFTLTTKNRGFFVEPNIDLAFSWNIFAETGATYSYKCTFTVEKRGVAPSTTSEPVPCALGANTHTFKGGIDQGTRLFKLEVETSDGKQNRQRPAGLLVNSIKGEITDTDPKDPDYNSTYYIDYFELTGLTVGDEVTFVLEAKGFTPYVSLYDKSKRNAQSGGGKLAEAGSAITFKVEAGVEYIVGVSTYRQKQTGTYELLTSQGTFTSFTFPTAQ